MRRYRKHGSVMGFIDSQKKEARSADREPKVVSPTEGLSAADAELLKNYKPSKGYHFMYANGPSDNKNKAKEQNQDQPRQASTTLDRNETGGDPAATGGTRGAPTAATAEKVKERRSTTVERAKTVKRFTKRNKQHMSQVDAIDSEIAKFQASLMNDIKHHEEYMAYLFLALNVVDQEIIDSQTQNNDLKKIMKKKKVRVNKSKVRV